MRHLRPGAAALLAATLLAGCAALPATGPHPAASVELPAQWSVPAPASAPAAIAAHWWSQLGDPELDRVVAQALAQNNDLQTALARVREAQAQLASANAAGTPQLNATLGTQSARTLGA
ncbi:MAG: TolC family protein, partial [Comamonas sp.]